MIASTEQLLEIQNTIINGIKAEQKTLNSLRDGEQNIVEKWHDFLGVMLPIQMETIKAYGYDADQTGLSDFNEQLTAACLEDEELKTMNQDKWHFIFKEAFGVDNVPELSGEQARDLVKKIADAMMSDEFLNEVKESIAEMEENSLIARRQKLITLLLPLHQSVIESHGYEGDLGYVQAQKGLIDHYSDPVIIELSNKAQATVFEACGIF